MASIVKNKSANWVLDCPSQTNSGDDALFISAAVSMGSKTDSEQVWGMHVKKGNNSNNRTDLNLNNMSRPEMMTIRDFIDAVLKDSEN